MHGYIHAYMHAYIHAYMHALVHVIQAFMHNTYTYKRVNVYECGSLVVYLDKYGGNVDSAVTVRVQASSSIL